MKTPILNSIVRILPVVACTLAAALFTGCASGNYAKGNSTGEHLLTSGDKIDLSTGKVDAALTALNDLVNNPGELQDRFKTFSSAVKSLQGTANDIGSKVASITKRGEAYFAAWDEQLAQIQNEDIKARSADRKAEVQKKFDGIKQSYETTSNDFKPFISDMKDIQAALSTDLTAGGVDSVKKAAANANKSGATLKEDLSKLAAQFKEVGVAMSAAVPEPAAK